MDGEALHAAVHGETKSQRWLSDWTELNWRNLYASQEATLRTRNGKTDCFKIGKGACQSCKLLPSLFNLYAQYIMQNAGLDELHKLGIKISGRNINNLRHADDTTLMPKSKVELKILLMRVKEESEKPGLKLNIQEN